MRHPGARRPGVRAAPLSASQPPQRETRPASRPHRAIESPVWAATGVGAVGIWAAWRASIDLDPGSLWLDDAWVTALAQAGSWSALGASPSSAPTGFKALVALAVGLGGDLEVAAQSVAFVSGLLGIGLVGALAFRLGGNAVAAFCAAAWVGFDSVFLLEMARVKPYTLDLCVVALQGLAFVALVEGYSRRRVWAFVVVVLAGLTVSSLSVFPALASLPVIAAVLWRRGIRDVHALAAAVLLVSALMDAGGLAAKATGADALRDFWRGHYLPGRDLASFLNAAGRWMGSWDTRLLHLSGPQAGALPLPGGLAAGLAIAGAAELWIARKRAHLAVGALLLAGVALASLLQVLPLGVQRVEMFLLPFAAVLMASAAGLVSRLPGRWAAGAGALALIALCVVQLPSRRLPRYPIQQAVPVIERLAAEYRPGDGLWANIRGTYVLALYAPWPVTYAPNDRLGIPHAVPDVPGFALLDGAGDGVVGGAPEAERIFVFVCNDGPPLLEEGGRQLRAAGYQEQGRFRARRCQVDWFVRAAN